MKLKWSLLAVVLIFCLILSFGMLYASGKDKKEAGKAEEEVAGVVELDMWLAYATDPENEYIKKLVDKFNQENPGIEVTLTIINWEGRRDKIILAAQGGTLPDMMSLDMPSIPDLVAQDVLVPLDEVADSKVIAEVQSRMVPEIWETVKWRGHIYMFPDFIDMTPFLIYNTEMFKKAGFVDSAGNPKPPATWDELIDYSKKLNSENVYGMVLTISPDIDVNVIEGLIFANGGRWLSEDGKKVIINDQAAIDVFQLWHDLVFKYKVTEPGVAETDFIAGNTIFFQNRAAMVLAWSWADALRDIAGAPLDFPYAVALAPRRSPVRGPFDSAPVLFAPYTGQVITTNCRDNDAAMKFIEFMATDEVLVPWGGEIITGRVPVVKDGFESDAFKKQYPNLYKMYKNGTLFEGGLSLPMFVGKTACEKIVYEEMQEVLIGSKSPKDAVASIAERAQKVIDKYQ